MKLILRKISTFLLPLLIMNLFGCATNTQTENTEIKQEQAIQVAKETPNAMPVNEIKSQTSDVVEGLMPPVNQNIVMFYFVQSGDTLTSIAKKIYGNSNAWKKLAEMNHIKNANQIYAGDFIHYELSEKSKTFTYIYENAPHAKIIVKNGDTLTEISRAIFGHAADWRVLWKENPQIKNPDKLIVGQEIYFRPKELKMQSKMNGEMIEKTAQNEKESVLENKEQIH